MGHPLIRRSVVQGVLGQDTEPHKHLRCVHWCVKGVDVHSEKNCQNEGMYLVKSQNKVIEALHKFSPLTIFPYIALLV